MKRDYKLDASVLALFPQDLQPLLKEAESMWRDIYNVIHHATKALFYGPPGTGKSSASAKHNLNGNALERFCITAETCAAQLSSFYAPGPHGMQVVHGPCVRAWLTPNCRTVIDELNEAGGDTIPLLHMFLDDSKVAKMTLADGTVIQPHEGFKCFATMNADPVSLPEALNDRFPIKRLVDRPDPYILMSLPASIRVAAAYSMFAKGAPQEAALRNLTTRGWVEIGRLIDSGLPEKEAVGLVLHPSRAAVAMKAIEVAAMKVKGETVAASINPAISNS